MKNPTAAGFSQAYTSQVRTDQVRWVIVGYSVSNQPTDVTEIGPALDSIPAEVEVGAAAYDTGYWCDAHGAELERRGSAAHIATGRLGPRREWQAPFEPPVPPRRDQTRRHGRAWATGCTPSGAS